MKSILKETITGDLIDLAMDGIIEWKVIERIQELEEQEEDKNNLVVCNNCGIVYVEEDLVPFDDERGGGFGCSECETDEYLMDIERESIKDRLNSKTKKIEELNNELDDEFTSVK